MVMKSEQLLSDISSELNEGEKRVRLVLASSHSIPDMRGVSLFDAEDEEKTEDERYAEDYSEEKEFVRIDSEFTEEHLISEDNQFNAKEVVNQPDETENEKNSSEKETEDEFNKRIFAEYIRRCEEEIPELDKDAEKYVMRCSGIMSESNGTITIRYSEDDSSGGDSTQSEIVIPLNRNDMVSVVRSGGIINTLVCEKGKRHISAYHTPIMPFEACVFTKNCEHNVTFKSGGYILLNYFIELRGTDMQHTKMRITVKPM